MRSIRMLTLVVSLFASTALYAQTSVEFSGHWVGSVQAPNGTIVPVEFDFGKDSQGRLKGTFGQPENQVKGLPISSFAVEGRAIQFLVKADVEPGNWRGEIDEEGTTINGELNQLGFAMPFRLKWKWIFLSV